MTSNSPLQSYARQMAEALDEQAQAAARVKEIKAEVKEEGFNLKAFNQAVKELRKGAKYQAAQLELELEMDTYRAAVGLPTTLEDAQERARKEAEAVPEKRKRELN